MQKCALTRSFFFNNFLCYNISDTMFVLILQRLLIEAVLDIIYFPVWWFTAGVVHAGKWCANLFRAGNFRLAPGLWLKNIAVPMYGQYDWQGKIISFFMRLIQVIFRSSLLLVWLAVCLSFFVFYLLLPVVATIGIIFSFTQIYG
jgi:hypothetical protein